MLNGGILFVDDDADLVAMAKSALSSHGFTIRVAASADEAIGIVNSGFSPDILCTDIVMPGGSGVNLARDLRKLIPDLKVLLITGKDEQVLPDNMRDGFDVLGKPYLFSTLARRLRAMVPPQD